MARDAASTSINEANSDAMELDDPEVVAPVKKKAKSSKKISAKQVVDEIVNDTAQASTSTQSLPDTSMLTASSSTSQKTARRAPVRYAWRTYSENISQMEDVLRRVKDLQDQGQGSSHLLDAKQRAPYTLEGATLTTDCYMGPIQSQSLQSIPVDTGKTLSKLVDEEERPGVLLNVGGHVYSVDWLPQTNNDMQYMCVSASMQARATTLIGEKLISKIVPARVQIWSIDQDYESSLTHVLCFNQGCITYIRWVPISSSSKGDSSILGLLSACMQDGTVGIYSVPHSSNFKRQKGPLYLKMDPLVQLNVKKGVPTCMEWHGADKLAIGYSDGWISVWSISSCLQVGTRRARPQILSKLSASPITCVSWHPDGRRIFSSSHDGSARCTLLDHPHLSTTIYHSRDVLYAIEFSQALDLPLMERPELDDIRSIDYQDGKFHLPTLYSHSGRIRTISLSPYHSFIASGSVDGSVRIVDLSRNIRSKGLKTTLRHVLAIFRLDKDRGRESLRFIENLAPFPASQPASASTTAWDPSISLTAVRWNTNQNTEGWLASAFACGLLRIDVVEEIML